MIIVAVFMFGANTFNVRTNTRIMASNLLDMTSNVIHLHRAFNAFTHIEHPEDAILTGDLDVLSWFATPPFIREDRWITRHRLGN